MKELCIERIVDASGIRSIKIENGMAMLSIDQGEPDQIIVKAKLNTRESVTADLLEDMIHIKNDGDEVVIVLDEYFSPDTRFRKREFVCRISIPANLKLEVENTNDKLIVEGVSASMKLINENGKIIIKDCSGAFDIENENGAIHLENCDGDIVVDQENGPIAGVKLSGDKLKIDTENGAVKIREAQFSDVLIKSENGSVFFETLSVDEGQIKLSSENGVIVLQIPESMEIDLSAETELGMIRYGSDLNQDEDGTYHLKRGEGKVKISLQTENSPIKIRHSGQYININLDVLRDKLAHLKASIAKSKTLEDKQQCVKIINNIIDYLNLLIKGAQDKELAVKLNSAIGKLHKTLDEIHLDEAKDQIIENIEQAANDIFAFVREMAEKVRERVDKEYDGRGFGGHMHRHMHKIFNKDQFKQMFEPLRKMKGFRFDLSDEEHNQVSERSRLKILEMLEAGKITAEEAEKLLKAIGKE